MRDEKSVREKSIGKMFDSSYRSKPKPAIFENFDASAKLHVNHILENKAKSVLDVGMGAGGILLVLQNQGVEKLFGVELSHDGIELAKQRFKMYGDISKANFFEGSFLDYNPEQVDAVSLHQVLHCHPDFKGMINKSVEASPQLIINTMPRKTWYTRLFIGIVSIFTMLKGFRAYVHSPREVENILSVQNYVKVITEKSFFWETSLFKLKQE
ncbi:MAG: class I SAM-dependent methyltransferase [Candidatus Kariarchaeaceae archaeon]|jgi:SAM-dependent methyltransferase